MFCAFEESYVVTVGAMYVTPDLVFVFWTHKKTANEKEKNTYADTMCGNTSIPVT